MKKSIGERIGDSLLTVFMVLLAVVMLYPFWHVLMYALSDSNLAMTGGVFLWPRGFTLKAITSMLQSSGLIRAFGNTVWRVVVGTLINMAVTITFAYPLSVRRFRGKKLLTMLALFTLLFSGGMIPTYLVVVDLGLYDSRWALVLPTAMSVNNLLIMRTFFRSIPEELEESARIDGASPFRILVQIMIPLAKPCIMTLMMFYAVAHWDSYLDSVLYINSSELEVLQMFLRKVINSYSMEAIGNTSNFAEYSSTLSQMSIQMAAIVVSSLPMICLYPFVQRFYTKGLMVGSVKG